jgi:hypothetical protein
MCFFYTKGGRFGLAPDPLPTQVIAGDKVVIFAGLKHPLLLRSVGDKFRLISRIYVHGIMNGEAWPENEHELERITMI